MLLQTVTPPGPRAACDARAPQHEVVIQPICGGDRLGGLAAADAPEEPGPALQKRPVIAHESPNKTDGAEQNGRCACACACACAGGVRSLAPTSRWCAISSFTHASTGPAPSTRRREYPPARVLSFC